MRNQIQTIFTFSFLILMLTGCYTQLEVVERPIYERTSYVYNQDRIQDRADELDYFDEGSYESGYNDAVSDLVYRDYSRKSQFSSSEYDLGYYEGYKDASWKFNRHRFRYQYHGYYWDPFYYDSYFAFRVSWNWYRPYYHFGYYSYHPYSYFGFVSYPSPYYPIGYYGYGYYPYNRGNYWVVYNNTVVVNNNVNHRPRTSGINRDRAIANNNSSRTGSRNNSLLNDNKSTRSSGIARGSSVSGDRGNANVNRTGRTNTGRSSGVQSSGSRSGSTATTPTRNTRPANVGSAPQRSGSSGGVQSSGSRGGSSSGGVRPSGGRSGSSSGSSGGSRPRGNNDDAIMSMNSSAVPRYSTAQPSVERPVYSPRSSALGTVSRSTTTNRSVLNTNRDNRENSNPSRMSNSNNVTNRTPMTTQTNHIPSNGTVNSRPALQNVAREVVRQVSPAVSNQSRTTTNNSSARQSSRTSGSSSEGNRTTRSRDN